MSKTTKNYGLVKPELTDAANITAMNPNWDKIDKTLADFDINQKKYNDRVVPIEKGGTGATTAEKARENLGCATSKTFSVSIPLSWTEDTTNGGYKQTVTVNGIIASDNPIVDVTLGNNAASSKTYLEAWGCVGRITTATNSITLYAYRNPPKTAFNIQLKVVR